MTSPIVLQQPGFGEAVSQGLAPLIQALQFRQKQQQEAEQLDLQRQQLEMQGIQQRQTARNQASDQIIRLMDALGPEILDDPSVQQIATQAGLNPKSVLRQFTTRKKAAEKQEVEQFDTWLQTLPEFLRPGQQAAFMAIRRGAGKEQAAALATTVTAANVTAERVEQMNKAFGGALATLPLPQKVEQYAQLIGLQAQVAAGLGPEARRDIQIEIDRVRLQLDRERLRMARLQDPKDKLPAVLAYIRIIDTTLADPLSTVSVANKSRDEQIATLFGPNALAAYQQALKFLQGQVSSTEQTR